MEEAAAVTRVYELAYHFIPDLEEAEVAAHLKDLESLVGKQGGSVITSREPKKIHLSYPIDHKYYGFFGVVEFSAQAEAITGLNAALKLQDGILRFLLVVKPTGKKEIRALGDQRNRRSRINVAPTHRPSTEPKAAPTEEKKIEKELEDVLEKL